MAGGQAQQVLPRLERTLEGRGQDALALRLAALVELVHLANHDLACARPVALVGGTEKLAFDYLGKAHDGIQRSLDLVDQLAERIGVRQE